jgi:hypothetical protein
MISRGIIGAAVIIAVANQAPPAAAAQTPAADQAAVVAVAESALAAVSRSDFVAFTDLMLDSAVTFAAGERNGQFRLQFRTRAQQRATPTGAKYTERGFRPEVHMSGPLAMVWLPYDFYRDNKWSHCGVDAFTLLKVDGRWRIATLVWSVEQPPACQRHPSGPPPGAVSD